MGFFGWLVVIVLLVVIAGGISYAAALARRSKAQLAASFEGAPGLSGGAPKEWAGQHTPEAKLHRRLVGLANTLAALPLGDADAIQRKVAVEQRVAELDRRLIAVALAPRSALREAVEKLTPDVDEAEAEVGRLATNPGLE